jgi:hypothetical protein
VGVVAVRALVLLVAVGCNPAPDAPTGPSVPSFRWQIMPVLALNCTATGCHGAEPDDSVTLDLRPRAAYQQLVDVPAEMGERHLMRVKPSDASESMLVHKLTGQLGHREGKRMPIDSQTGEPIEPSPLPQWFVDDSLVPWILAGAPDN